MVLIVAKSMFPKKSTTIITILKSKSGKNSINPTSKLNNWKIKTNGNKINSNV